MIAYAGYKRLQAGQQDELAVSCVPRWPISDLPSVSNLASTQISQC